MIQEQALLELDRILGELNKTSMGRRAFLASVPMLLAACATQSEHRNREGDNSGQDTELTIEGEKKLTQEAMAQMRKDYPAANSAEAQTYISQLGARVATSSGLEGNPYNYNFTVVDVPMVNAFALPAGTVFVTAPLIAMVENEAELAGVLGHEIGHIKARHTAERMHKAKQEQTKSWLLAGGVGVLGGILGYGVGRASCGKDKECLRKATEIGAIAGVGGGLLIHKYKFMANSREDEMEADRIGFRTSVNAGFHKDYVGGFYSKLLKMEQQHKSGQNKIMSSVADAMSTHPPSKERVKQMDQLANSVDLSRQAIISSGGFDRFQNIARQFAARHQKS